MVFSALTASQDAKEPNSSNNPYERDIKQTWQTTRFSLHHVADPTALCYTDPETFRLQVPDVCRETKEEIIKPIVEIIGEYPVAYGGYSDIWQGILKSDESHIHELVTNYVSCGDRGEMTPISPGCC